MKGLTYIWKEAYVCLTTCTTSSYEINNDFKGHLNINLLPKVDGEVNASSQFNVY